MDEKFMDFYTKAEINEMLGGMNFKKLSQEEFDAIINKDPNTIYYVYDDEGNVTQYIGNAALGGGAVPAMSIINAAGAVGVAGDATQVGEE